MYIFTKRIKKQDEGKRKPKQLVFVKQVAPLPIPALVKGTPDEQGDMGMEEYYRYKYYKQKYRHEKYAKYFKEEKDELPPTKGTELYC